MDILKKIQWNAVITSVICILLGAVLVVFPTAVNEMIAYVIAASMFMVSVIGFYNYFKKDIKRQFYRNDLVYSVVTLVVGIILLAKRDMIISLIPIFLGALIIVSGVKKLQNALDMLRLGIGGWKPILALSAVNIIFGVIMVICAKETADVITVLIGIGLVYSGGTDLFSAIWVSKSAKRYDSESDEDADGLIQIGDGSDSEE